MTRFTCRGFEGTVGEWPPGVDGPWFAFVHITGTDIVIRADGKTAAAAKARVRRKLDAVERALRGRWRRHG